MSSAMTSSIADEHIRRALGKPEPVENTMLTKSQLVKLDRSMTWHPLCSNSNLASPCQSTKEGAMDATTHTVTSRIFWCRRQRAKARTNAELEAWLAEEAGLRDAVLHRDHVSKYRLRSSELFERYLLGFQDAKALMRAARATRFSQSVGDRIQPHIGYSWRTVSTALPSCLHYRRSLSALPDGNPRRTDSIFRHLPIGNRSGNLKAAKTV